MSLLVYVFHPNFSSSSINKAYVEELRRLPETEVVIVDGKTPLDVKAEQARMEKHGKIIWQFPIWWFAAPACFYSFLEKVFTAGWAYMCSSPKLAGKKVGFAISLGATESDEEQGWPVSKLTDSMRIVLDYTGQTFGGLFASRGSKDVKGYLKFIEEFRK